MDTVFSVLMRKMLEEKGYSIPEAVERLRQHGADDAMIGWFLASLAGFEGAGSEPSDN